MTRKKVLFAPFEKGRIMSCFLAKCSISLILIKVFPVPVPKQTMIFFSMADSNSSNWYSRGTIFSGLVSELLLLAISDQWTSNGIRSEGCFTKANKSRKIKIYIGLWREKFRCIEQNKTKDLKPALSQCFQQFWQTQNLFKPFTPDFL